MASSFAVLLSLTSCTDETVEPLDPQGPLMDECATCVKDDDGSGSHSWADDVYDENGDDHNDGLRAVYDALEDSAAVYGPLSNEKAESIARAFADEYLVARGYSPDPELWDEVMDAVQRHDSGEDIVAAYAPNDMSSSGRELSYDFVGAAGKEFYQISDDMSALKDDALNQLTGDEEELFVAMAGMGDYSATYWDSNLQAWDGTLAYSMSGCGANAALGDVLGAYVGATRAWLLGGGGIIAGGLVGAVYGSAAAFLICTLLD